MNFHIDHMFSIEVHETIDTANKTPWLGRILRRFSGLHTFKCGIWIQAMGYRPCRKQIRLFIDMGSADEY